MEEIISVLHTLISASTDGPELSHKNVIIFIKVIDVITNGGFESENLHSYSCCAHTSVLTQLVCAVSVYPGL